MITFEEIVNEKDKAKRDLLIKTKLEELNSTTESVNIGTSSLVRGFISDKSTVRFDDFDFDLEYDLKSVYGMKATDYFYEFFDLLVANNSINKISAINNISFFLKRYFNEPGEKKNDRDAMFGSFSNKLLEIADNEDEFHKQKNALFDIGVFKNMSSAECTEHACIAQNLLSFCDVDSCYVTGVALIPGNKEIHAFNVIQVDGNYYVFDGTNPFYLYDENEKYISCRSYVFKIPQDKIVDFMNGKERLKIPKCNYQRKADGETIMVDMEHWGFVIDSKPLDKDAFDSFLGAEVKVL